ncbi:type II toxin-antitoxin system PemK/MazF family toxin [Alkalibacterium olivapovliticus]|uniref:mRNA interferase MazF n=1 Tax=Alkalibacterium olivapovliticus TaxID=99907 RepID=A0A2T0WC29_9LACT|nr:type II toxin-antitoxin system PemK/MazF family toxin [Alkalibacterium olivapovliticus]PRY84269.1 mRNA interferase MazF [Alkalibacterium olivapovliticus]
MSIPKAGDIILVSLDPTKGHEQGDYRPCLVISETYYNKRVNMCVVLPITHSKKGYPFEVELPSSLMTKGVVLTDSINTIDIKARSYKIIERLPLPILNTCRKNVAKLIGA